MRVGNSSYDDRCLTAISAALPRLGDIHCALAGTTALDMGLPSRLYRRPSDIDLAFYLPPGTPVDAKREKQIYAWFQDVAASMGCQVRTAYGKIHQADEKGRERENFSANRILFYSPQGDTLAQCDYYILNNRDPFLTAVASPVLGESSTMLSEPLEEVLAFKLARHLTQQKQGVHDVQDIAEALNRGAIDFSDPYRKELFRLRFLLCLAEKTGDASDGIQINRLYGQESNLKDNYQASKASLQASAGRSLEDALGIVREQCLKPVFGKETKPGSSLLRPAEVHYLEQLREGINAPEILAQDYPLIFARHPGITDTIRNSPFISNMMSEECRRFR